MNAATPETLRAGPRLPAVLALAAALSSCAGRAPVLVPPSSGAEAVEGFGSAVLDGPEARMKGKFAFLFRLPDLGRIEALDPVGRTAFTILFRGDRAYFVLPAKKVYTDESPETMMARFLGVALLPGEMVSLLCGTWAGTGGDAEGLVERDGQGRIVRGGKEGFSFTVRKFFPGAGVPRELGLDGPGTTGRMKILSIGFDPPAREGAFDAGFLRAYARRTWDEILEIVDR